MKQQNDYLLLHCPPLSLLFDAKCILRYFAGSSPHKSTLDASIHKMGGATTHLGISSVPVSMWTWLRLMTSQKYTRTQVQTSTHILIMRGKSHKRQSDKLQSLNIICPSLDIMVCKWWDLQSHHPFCQSTRLSTDFRGSHIDSAYAYSVYGSCCGQAGRRAISCH